MYMGLKTEYIIQLFKNKSYSKRLRFGDAAILKHTQENIDWFLDYLVHMQGVQSHGVEQLLYLLHI